MHRSSESIGTIAAALAKAQVELTNPEKSLCRNDPVRLPAGERSDLPLCPALERPGDRAQEPGPA